MAEAVKNAWLVIEAIPEKLSIKQDVFALLEKFAPEDAILASNSSSFKSREIAEHLNTPYRGKLKLAKRRNLSVGEHQSDNIISLQYALL